MLMLKSSLVLLKLSSIDVGFVSNYYLEYWHFWKMSQISNNLDISYLQLTIRLTLISWKVYKTLLSLQGFIYIKIKTFRKLAKRFKILVSCKKLLTESLSLRS